MLQRSLFTEPKQQEDAVQNFLSRHAGSISGVLSGLDRVVFRGVLRQLSHAAGLLSFLCYRKVLLKDFKEFAMDLTKQIVTRSEAVAKSHGRPFLFLQSSSERKEDVARRLLQEHPTDSGLVCVLKCVESCRTFEVHKSAERQKLELRSRQGQCSHLYHYFLDPQLGWGHVRVQAWFPFLVQVVINGREWLAGELRRDGIEHVQRDNCIVSVADPQRAQQLLDRQLQVAWPKLLDGLAHAANPAHNDLFCGDVMPRYWVVHQMEWATDVLFRSEQALAALYPDLTLHAIRNFSSRDVMRFLQKKLNGHFLGDVTSHYRARVEGVCVKHFVNSNSIKMYDKQGSALRVETTLNQVRGIKTYRPKEGDPDGPRAWRTCRKGVADFHRAAEVSQKANECYLDALASVPSDKKLSDILATITKPTKLQQRHVRGLRPWSTSDLELLKAVSAGEFVLNGFRNKDIVARLFPGELSVAESRRASAKVGRLLRLLRAHKIIQRLPSTHRYRVTDAGREVFTAVLAAHAARVSALINAA